MCGLVFVGGRTLVSKEITLFERLLMCDSFRGMHSTGVFAGFDMPGGNQYKLAKARLDGFDFVRTDLWEETRAFVTETPPTYATGKPIRNVKAPNFIFGHNRYATVGAINAANAHPFQHGHITLAHNGTLNDQGLLPDHKNFEVDSENVCYSMFKKGVDWTIQNLDGAFTLIWHDAEKKTLNIIRNSERPFHLAQTACGDWFGASEKDMLLWILTRDKYHSKINRNFECEVGVQYVFDVSTGCTLKEEIKHTLPTFTKKYTSYYSTSRYYDDAYTTSGSTSGWPQDKDRSTRAALTLSDKNDEINNLLSDSGLPTLKVDRPITFNSYSFQPYQTNHLRGKLEGCLPDHTEFVDIHCHGFEKKDYVEDTAYQAIIVSAYEQNAILTIIVKNASVVDEDDGFQSREVIDMVDLLNTAGGGVLDQDVDDDIPFDLEMQKLPSGEKVTRDEWDSSPHTVCGNCDHPIAFDSIPDIQAYGGSFVCGACCDDLLAEEEAQKQKAVTESGATFCCTGCSQDVDENLRSPDYPIMCIECATMFKPEPEVNVHPLRRTTMHGMSVTIPQWNKINSCCICKHRISFAHVEVVPFVGSNPVCLECEPKLKKGK